jgi:hypothetical protein
VCVYLNRNGEVCCRFIEVVYVNLFNNCSNSSMGALRISTTQTEIHVLWDDAVAMGETFLTFRRFAAPSKQLVPFSKELSVTVNKTRTLRNSNVRTSYLARFSLHFFLRRCLSIIIFHTGNYHKITTLYVVSKRKNSPISAISSTYHNYLLFRFDTQDFYRSRVYVRTGHNGSRNKMVYTTDRTDD